MLVDHERSRSSRYKSTGLLILHSTVTLLAPSSQCRSVPLCLSLFLAPSHNISCHYLALYFFYLSRRHTEAHTRSTYINTYTKHSNTITSGHRLLENHPNLSSPQSWKKGGRFPSYIKGEVVASVPASLHLSPVYSNHTAAVSSSAFILLYFSISLFCFSPDSDWVSSAPGEQSYEPDVLS